MTKEKSPDQLLHERIESLTRSDLERFMHRLMVEMPREERIEKVAMYTGLSEAFLRGEEEDHPA